MIIRKLFKFEGAHIVRNCSSTRCKYSIHGHSYRVELFFTATGLDNGMMVMDFGIMKGNIKDLVDSFDHAYSMWSAEDDEFKEFIRNQSDRWIEMPVSPSAEAYAIMLFKIIDAIIKATEFANGEEGVELYSVRVHETDTGYAEAFRSDLSWVDFTLEDVVFSDGVVDEWNDSDMYNKLIEAHYQNKKCFYNSPVEQQV